MFFLNCSYQNYAWGKTASESEVYKLLQADNKNNLELDETSRFAELWMGTHVSGASKLLNGSLLSEHLENHVDELGKPVLNKFGKQLPFLFKVLSVDKALSIQAHPSKSHAEELHAARPDLYKDANHKPEMAVALTEFEALCGFRLICDIVNFAAQHVELRQLLAITNNQINDLTKTTVDPKILHQWFDNLMQSPTTIVTAAVRKLTQKLSVLDSSLRSTEDSVFLRLVEQFPDDVGCFSVYLLNRVMLKPGEAIFLESNLPHAYLSGDCVEIMACSDNVVRAGLTPKFKDVETLLLMLNYSSLTEEQVLFRWESAENSPFLRHYSPPVADFSLDRLQLLSSSILQQIDLPAVNGASILLCVQGAASLLLPGDDAEQQQISRGNILYLPANLTLEIQVLPDSNLLLFRAFCDLRSDS